MIVYHFEFAFSEEKEKWLQETRGISFVDLIEQMKSEGVGHGYEHPNQKKYPSQFVFEAEFEGYVYIIPAVWHGKKMFLKTAFPSRKATKRKNKERNK
jgi:hypothetical protein